MKIHPTAIVPEGAKLADDVEIGPGSILSAQAEIGPGCVIGARVILEHRVVMGSGTKVGHGSIIGANPQDLDFDQGRTDTGVILGCNNIIREYVTIHRATNPDGDTVVGDNCFIMTGCHLAHDNVVGDGVIMANNALTAGHVQIGDRSFIGGGSVFHQFIRIGRLSMVRGGCRFSKDIPPYLVATGENQVAGVNAVGLRRAGFGEAVRSEIKKAFRLLYCSGSNISQALEAARNDSWGARRRRCSDSSARRKSVVSRDYKGKPKSDAE